MKLHLPGSRGLALAAGTGAVALALPYVTPVAHHYPWDEIPGFYAVYGGLGCAAIVLVSKALGKALLQRPEDWYDRTRARKPKGRRSGERHR